ncbi:hypothetical protein [Nitrosomonas halophila]|uniref:CDP-Glycerol:Poly(Glycerophosphate) glycerophosphotransferase n=1 Tax=Nitrosomonas halophila TaxID=44576 RepID=A0A1H3JD51_9PROT|nr:hypothetical protein [Nitrosomonas halophila]SDY37328.1 hypothetical protein SAMN05421881_10322 [Nitrosomonas halophila]
MMKALFFLRHYNDVDHITPVITRWIESGNTCDVVLIGFDRFQHDYRIAHLSQYASVRLAHIRDVISGPLYLAWRLQMVPVLNTFHRSSLKASVEVVNKLWPKRRREALWRRVSRQLLDRTFGHDGRGVIAFDWVERNTTIATEWIEILLTMARARGLSTVSLPHGDSPHANRLIRRNERRPGPDPVFSAAAMFDKVVVPNELCATRFRPFMKHEDVAVLGSPRYCDEWLTRLADITPPSPLVRDDSRFKMVLFLRKATFTTFWEEVGIVIHMLADFPNLELVIKPHTRGGWQQRLTWDRSIRRRANVHIADSNLHSPHLIDWADAIMDVATSVSFEAVKLNKPVLAADYLHAGRSVVADYMPETALNCRDDIYYKTEALLRNGGKNFYNTANRQRFIHEIIDQGKPDILLRYVQFLSRET